jgi:Uncharacterised nucleotidyltransferase
MPSTRSRTSVRSPAGGARLPSADRDPLLLTLRDPRRLTRLDQPAWRDLLARARGSGLTARLESVVSDAGVMERIPAKARVQLVEARIALRRNQTDLRFEVDRVARALGELDGPIVLLKGAAYLLADLPPAHRRFATDLDLMVPRARLEAAEGLLLAAGWQRAKLTPYDERYYRIWMHEIPPLWHPERLFAVDLHHTILPTTSRYRPDVEALFAAAVALDHGALKVLCPADMVLHAAAHLFTEEMISGLRQLADIHDLLEHFGRFDGFWEELLTRSRIHGLERVLYYALRHASRLLNTALPDDLRAAVEAHRPNIVTRTIMDAAVTTAVRPAPPEERHRPGRRIALRLLHLRSHWLKMPPTLLARHLATKTLRTMRSRFRLAAARVAPTSH